MKKLLSLLAVPAVLLTPTLAKAAEVSAGAAGQVVTPGVTVGTGLAIVGVGLTVVGAGLGIGRIGGSAMEGIARQPEAGARIAANMIIAAALVEGATLFAIVVAFLKV